MSDRLKIEGRGTTQPIAHVPRTELEEPRSLDVGNLPPPPQRDTSRRSSSTEAGAPAQAVFLRSQDAPAPMRTWEHFLRNPRLAAKSRGFRASDASLRFALEELLATFGDPHNDARLRALVERRLSRLPVSRPAESLRRAIERLSIPERQSLALIQIIGWFKNHELDRELRLEAIHKLGWVGSADAEVALLQRFDDGFAGERDAAREAHRRLIARGVIDRSVPNAIRSQQKRALLDLVETCTGEADGSLRAAAAETLARYGDVAEHPKSSSEHRPRVALTYLLLTLDDPWTDGWLMGRIAEKLGDVGDAYSARVLARFARLMPRSEREEALKAVRKIHKRGQLERSRFTPAHFETFGADEKSEWLFRNARVLARKPVGDIKGVNDSHFVLVSATSIAEAVEYWAMGIFKPAACYGDAGWQYGAAAYEISKGVFRGKTNPVPPTFETILDGEPGGVQFLVTGETAQALIRGGGAHDFAKLGRMEAIARQVSDAMVFDRLIENSDRFQSWGDVDAQNVGNFMFAHDTTLLLIDHDFTFGRGPHASFLPERYNRDTIENLKTMQSSWSELEERLRIYLHPAQIRRVRAALEEILADAARGGPAAYFD